VVSIQAGGEVEEQMGRRCGGFWGITIPFIYSDLFSRCHIGRAVNDLI
jgi:hypothetical protein